MALPFKLVCLTETENNDPDRRKQVWYTVNGKLSFIYLYGRTIRQLITRYYEPHIDSDWGWTVEGILKEPTLHPLPGYEKKWEKALYEYKQWLVMRNL